MKHLLAGREIFLALLLTASAACAQTPELAVGALPANPTNAMLSATAATNRAAWQQHLTLGPGDIVSVSLYSDQGRSEVWPNVVIGPDGRINYLEAHDIPAAGLTIDELRTNVDAALTGSSNYQSPHSIIIPVAINSKKFFVLGAVVRKGVFTLDRPQTIIEAIAQAGGLETGVFERNAVELADLSHSFMVRNGQRLPIDFEKLFQQGDLSQNVPVEPNDYLYFASSGANEIYVLGEVQLPGIVPYSPSANIIGAITTRGGFTAKAYRARVLVVRGSLTHPEGIIVNTADMLSAKAGNFRLKSGDIVYVSQKPWQIVQDALDEATRAFITAFVASYTGAYVGPFIEQPIVGH
jgi:protein involved in polysaccharide export with SLBB domain